MRTLVLVAGLALLAGLVAPVAAGSGTSGDGTGLAGADDWCPADRPAPETDRLGWENGCWWDAPIELDRSDGLNQTERRAVVGRSMARIERVRELEFQRDVPVEVVSRETHRESFAERYNVTTDARLRENVVLEGALLVGEGTDAVAAQRRMFGSATLGYYDTAEDRIVIISENTSTPKLNEITLSQELFHALQDARWNISSYDRGTWEATNAINGIVEGDGNYVDHLYEGRCETDWDCLEPAGTPTPGDIHLGLYTLFFQPYSDGPAFVQGIRETSGWDGVNAVYEDPPASSEQTIHPERYPEEVPANVTVADTAGEAWRVPEVPAGTATYGELGEAGLYTMFLYSAIDSGGTVRADLAQNFYNVAPSDIPDSLDPYNYSYVASEGWAGDRLLPYVRADSAETNETAYVWKLAWDSPEDAREFREEYYRLLQYYGAEPVEGHLDTFRIPDGESFGDAFFVSLENETVVIVNAPTVDDLRSVRAGAAPSGTQDLDGTVWAENASETTDTATPGSPGKATDGTVGPGLGVLVTFGAFTLLVVIMLLRSRAG